MSLSGFVEDRPVASLLLFGLVAVGLTALLATVFTQGTFVDDNGCTYTPFNNPSGGNFTSIDQVENFFEENNREMPSDLLLQERDGIVYHSVQDECGTVGGGN
jgi:hypothetical protein